MVILKKTFRTFWHLIVFALTLSHSAIASDEPSRLDLIKQEIQKHIFSRFKGQTVQCQPLVPSQKEDQEEPAIKAVTLDFQKKSETLQKERAWMIDQLAKKENTAMLEFHVVHLKKEEIKDFTQLFKSHALFFIKKFDFSDIHLDEKAAKEFIRVLKKNPFLNQLSFTHNKFDPSAADILINELKEHSALENLSFKNTHLTEKQMKNLSAVLEKNPIKQLTLNNTQFGPEGIQALTSGLEKCTRLESLDLSENHLRSTGVNALIPILKNMLLLKTVKIHKENYFFPEDWERLKTSLPNVHFF
jgi:hypothetical protein